ncbi:hypothetical protein G9A89_004592 [Geosiphon pyriformis]|nr:hypothetical protein G9A89_004592 [Geosiphon pyriformis]
MTQKLIYILSATIICLALVSSHPIYLSSSDSSFLRRGLSSTYQNSLNSNESYDIGKEKTKGKSPEKAPTAPVKTDPSKPLPDVSTIVPETKNTSLDDKSNGKQNGIGNVGQHNGENNGIGNNPEVPLVKSDPSVTISGSQPQPSASSLNPNSEPQPPVKTKKSPAKKPFKKSSKKSHNKKPKKSGNSKSKNSKPNSSNPIKEKNPISDPTPNKNGIAGNENENVPITPETSTDGSASATGKPSANGTKPITPDTSAKGNETIPDKSADGNIPIIPEPPANGKKSKNGQNNGKGNKGLHNGENNGKGNYEPSSIFH